MKAFVQVSDLRRVTITASDVAWPSLAAPISLPKSDIDRCERDTPVMVNRSMWDGLEHRQVVVSVSASVLELSAPPSSLLAGRGAMSVASKIRCK